jgi:hypothetical protein
MAMEENSISSKVDGNGSSVLETVVHAPLTDRQYYIDWIRVTAFFILIFFHCAMPFVGFYHWEVRNGESSVWIDRLIIWLHQWRLPLLFFISWNRNIFLT